MRVATYTQPAELTRGSLLALAILVATVLLGTSAASQLLGHFVPPLAPLVTFMWMGLYLLTFGALMFSRGLDWVSWLARYRILLVVVLVGAVASVAWSIDTRLSAERAVHLVGTSMIGIYLGFTIPLMTMLRVFAVVLGGIVLASFPAALLMPDMGLVDYEGGVAWSGVTNSKNQLGFWAASGVLLYITLSDSARSLWTRLLCYLFAGLSLVLLVFSQSATALLAMLLAGALSLYLFVAGRFQLGFVRMGVLAVLLAALVALAFVNIDTNELVGRSDDLTGRGEVWRQTWKLIMERPLSGYGYGSLWFPTDATLWIQQSLTDFSWVVYHAHNGFLQVASEIGLPLSILALLMVVQQMIEIFYCQYQRQQPGVLFVLAFFIAYLAGNFSEARFLVTRELYWVFFIALPISMLRQINLVADESGERAAAPGGPSWQRAGAPPIGAAGPGGAAPTGAYGASANGSLPHGAVSGITTSGAAVSGAASSGTTAPGAATSDGAPRPSSDPTGGFGGRAVAGRWEDDASGPSSSGARGQGGFRSVAADIDLGGEESGAAANGPRVPGSAGAGAHGSDEVGADVARPRRERPENGTDEAREDRSRDSGPVERPAADVDAFVFEADRFDMDFDEMSDGTDEWADVPFDDETRPDAARSKAIPPTRRRSDG